MSESPLKLSIAANQGEFGGGEVMLIAIAEAARDLGYEVTVVAPATPGDVVEHARKCGFEVVAIPSASRAQYLMNLKRWDLRHRKGLLWCNGLRPALATAGHRNRVVHLHQKPQGLTGRTAPLARLGARKTVVPSHYMTQFVPGSTVLWNWTPGEPTSSQTKESAARDIPTIGYMGRLSEGKGLKILCAALNEMAAEGRHVNLLLAGEARFVSGDERDDIEEGLTRLKVNHLDRRGWVERDDFFQSVDLAVFPSIAPESFGLVVSEAMAAQCPFIISDAGALREVAGNDYPYTCRAGDPQDLAQILTQALTDDWAPQLAKSYDRWSQNFTAQAGRERLSALLKSLEGN